MADGELPRAVAAGSNGQLVRAPRAAIIAAVLAAGFVYALFAVREVPGRAIALIGGKGHGVARWGGVVATWIPGQETMNLVDREPDPDDPKIEIHREGDREVLELARVPEKDAADVIARLSAGGGLEFREVIESDALTQLVRLGLARMPMHHDDDATEPTVEIDLWRPEDSGGKHTDYYLAGHDRRVLERTVAEAQRQGWSLPPGTQIAFEQIEPLAEMKDQRIAWRTYFVSTEVALDGSAVATAEGTYDVNTNRPVIMLEFTRKGARTFGDLTARISGHKLATLLGGVVKSAPIINGPIRGGRAQITMGGSDPVHAEHERDVLVEVLKLGSLPLGGQIKDATWVPPSEATRVAIAHVLVALAGGLLAFLAALLVIRISRPERARADELATDTQRPKLGARLGWTGFALAVYAIGTNMVLPGINEFELGHIVAKGRSHLDLTQFSLFALGIMPLLTSFVTVEVIASIVPRWRRLRDTLRGRRRLELATTIVAIAICCVQAYFVVHYIQGLARGGVEIYDDKMFWPTAATIAAGPMVLAILASAITNRGLGNGYAVLFVFAWLWRNPWWDFPDLPGGELALAALTIALSAAVAYALVSWRVASPGRVAVPLPSASVAPLHDGGGVLALVGTLSALGVTMPIAMLEATSSLKSSLALGVAVLVAFTAIWAFAFARPGRRRTELAAAGLEPADRPQWARGILISAAGLATLLALALLRPTNRLVSLSDPALVIIATATVADLAAEWRARRRAALVAVWQLHDPLLLDAARGRLALAGIPHFIQATRMRSLLWIFGSYVPMTVYVPTAHAEAAHANMKTWLDAA